MICFPAAGGGANKDIVAIVHSIENQKLKHTITPHE